MFTQTKSNKYNNKIIMTLAVVGVISILLTACKPGSKSKSSNPSQQVSNTNTNEYTDSSDTVLNCQSKEVFCIGQGTIATVIKVDIPQGAYVADAYMKFYPFQVQSQYQKNIQLHISLEPSTGDDLSRLSQQQKESLLDKSIPWSVDKWSTGANKPVTTPNLADRLQEIVNDSNWKSGSYVNLIIQNINHDYTEGELRLAHFPQDKLVTSPELSYTFVEDAEQLKKDLANLEQTTEAVEKNYDFISKQASLLGINSKYLFQQIDALLKPKDNVTAPATTSSLKVDDNILSKPSENTHNIYLGDFQQWREMVANTIGSAILFEKNLPTSTLNVLAGNNYKLSVSAIGKNLHYTWYKNGQVKASNMNPELVITAPSAGSTDSYYVEIQSSDDKVTSNKAFVKGVAPSETKPPGTVKLSWAPPQTREDGSSISMGELAGYKIGYFKEGESVQKAKSITVDDGGTTELVIKNLTSGVRYYFFIKSMDTNGLESSSSPLVSTIVL